MRYHTIFFLDSFSTFSSSHDFGAHRQRVGPDLNSPIDERNLDTFDQEKKSTLGVSKTVVSHYFLMG